MTTRTTGRRGFVDRVGADAELLCILFYVDAA